jgi:hypothetical protein
MENDNPIIAISKNKKKNKKKKHRVVYESYPTFFARDDEDFRNWIRKTLYGDTNNEQDSDKETDGGTEGATCRQAETGKS